MSKGKGKQREQQPVNEGDDNQNATLFVSNLSYGTTSQALESYFSDIAPVRNCFIVTRKNPVSGEGINKGVGYVSFAVKEDAASVLDAHSKKPFIIDGRAVRLELAERKDPSHIRAERAAAAQDLPPPPPPPGSRSTIARDKTASRTVVISISSPPSDTSQKTLWKKIRKYAGAQSVVYPVEPASGSPGPSHTGIAHAVFETAIQAQDAAKRLHAHVWKGALLSAVVKKKTDQYGVKGKAAADARLIVRNLPRDITEDDLRRVFVPHAPIHSVHIPTAPNPNVKHRFAFVQLYTKLDAAKALSAVNGTRVTTGLASRVGEPPGGVASIKPEPVIDVVKKEEDPDEPMLLAGPSSVDDTKAEEDIHHDAVVVDEKPPKPKGRIVAVDWALSKADWEKEQKEATRKAEEVDGEVQDDWDHSMALGESTIKSDEDHNAEDVTSDSGEDREDDEDEPEEDGRSHPPPPDEGTTLFIRNLPFEATDEDLGDLLKTFGPMRYCRVTMDNETGRSRGTGFVCFWKKPTADAVMEEAERMTTSLGTGEPGPQAAAHAFTLLTPDPSSSLSARLVLMGRTLNITRAVTRDEAGHLRDIAEKQRDKKDTRNLYLLREGVIFADTPAASLIPPLDLKRRHQAYEERRASLRTNPLLFVSRTRLSVRNLPHWVTDRGLRKLGVHAVERFKAEVNTGEREDLTRDEHDVDDRMAEEVAATVPEDGSQHVAGKPPRKSKWKFTSSNKVVVKQAKIARSPDRLDPFSSSGLGRSTGFGFLEMEKHTDTLRVLRWTNNRPGVSEMLRGWWRVELKEIVAREKTQQSKVKKEKDGSKAVGTGVHHAVTDEDARRARLLLWERTLKEMEHENDEGNGSADQEPSGPAKWKGKPLLVEFSIENRLVVKKRADKLKRTQAPMPDVSKPDVLGVKRRRKDEQDDATVRSEHPPLKKIKAEDAEFGPNTTDSGASQKKRKGKNKFLK